MTQAGHAAAMSEQITREREVDARWTPRKTQVGGMQGRGDPPATRYHCEAANVAPIKSSTPRYPQPEEHEGPGLLVSPEFWILGGVCLLVWFGLYVALTQ